MLWGGWGENLPIMRLPLPSDPEVLPFCQVCPAIGFLLLPSFHCMARPQSSYLLVDENLNCFYSFTIAHKTVNILKQVSVWKVIFSSPG